MGPALAPGLASLEISDAAVHAFAAALQGVVVAGVETDLPSPFPTAPARRIAALFLLNLHFECRMAGYGGLLSIWGEVARVKGHTKGLATLNQVLLWGILSCRRFFGRRSQFSASLLLLEFIKTISLMNLSLEPACAGGRFTPWMTRQGTVEVLIHLGLDASLLAHHLYGRLASKGLLVDRHSGPPGCYSVCRRGALQLGHLCICCVAPLICRGRHTEAVTEIVRIINRLEELHTEVQEMIKSSHLATTLIYNRPRKWITYLNRCVVASSLEDVEAPSETVPFSLEPILLEMESGRYVVPLLPATLVEMVSGGRGSNGIRGGKGSGIGSDGVIGGSRVIGEGREGRYESGVKIGGKDWSGDGAGTGGPVDDTST